MQNDYQILYNVLKEKVTCLETSWKTVLLQLKSVHEITNIHKSDSNINASARRINPTLLKQEHHSILPADGNNPFTHVDSSEFPLNRPLRKSNPEPITAWKKVSAPVVAKFIEQIDTRSVKFECTAIFKDANVPEFQENIKKLASAYFQIVFDQVTIDFGSFTEAFDIILRILTVGHELFSLNSFSPILVDEFLLKSLSPPISENLNIFRNSVELFLFSIYWIQGAREELSKLFPDALKCFVKNSMLDCIDPSMVQVFRGSISNKEDLANQGNQNFLSLSLHSLLPVAYSNQRDSKNFLRDPNSHSNQQKTRDLFINLVRHFSTNQLDTSHPGFHRSFTSRVSELISKLNHENYSWLADLYIQEYEQAADVRLDRLEERMSSKKSGNTTFSLDEIFFLFLQYADSFRLTRAVEKKVIAVISISLDQANNPHKRALWPDCLRKLRSIIKLLAFCRYRMSESTNSFDAGDVSVDEEDVLIYSWTEDSVLNKHLLTLLPLIHEYFIFIGPDAVKSRCSNTVKLLLRYYQVKFERRKRKPSSSKTSRSRMFLRLGLEDIFRETLSPEFYTECVMAMRLENGDEGRTEESEELDEKRISRTESIKATRPSCLDEDEILPPGVSNVYRSISSQIRHIYVQLNSICMSMSQNHIESRSSLSESSSDNAIPRKVRPVTQVPAADLIQQKVQKQLRQWFWWRYGSQKDLIDALNSYILEQLLFPQFTVLTTDRNQSATACLEMYRELIYKILPDLLPAFWKENSELIEIILGLTIEVAEKIIKNHFS